MMCNFTPVNSTLLQFGSRFSALEFWKLHLTLLQVAECAN